METASLATKIPHHWVVAVICSQCGKTQDKAHRWCQPLIDLPREPGA